MFWRVIYNLLLIPLVRLLLPVLRLFDRKMRRGIDGREGLFQTLEKAVDRLSRGTGTAAVPRVWFHSSSMGEFEQAKPIIAELRRRYKEIQIIVSFFSPSGYDHSKSYKQADIITYIPFDTPGDAKRFIELIRPTAAVLVRYDVWSNHIWALRDAHIPIYIANATLSSGSPRSYPVFRQFHYTLYNAIDYILTVSESDKQAFERFRLDRPLVAVIGDTRYDQVIQRNKEAAGRHLFPSGFFDGKRVLVAGSSWGEDEEVLIPAIARLFGEIPEFVAIIVPHEPTEEHLEALEDRIGASASSIRFSTLSNYRGERIIIVDSIGILTTVYKYAHLAYVGGSFRQGIHNVLEPAVYGIPVVMGPKHENSHEAREMLDLGAAFTATDEEEMYAVIRRMLVQETDRIAAGALSAGYVREHAGATDRFLSYLSKVIDYPVVQQR